MKRYILSAEELIDDDIESRIVEQLDAKGLSDAVRSLTCTEKSSRSCEVIAYLSNKYHGKKVRELVPYKNADPAIEQFINQIANYTNTGKTILDEDAYVFALTYDGQLIGYIGRPTGGRGRYWAYMYEDPADKKVRRFKNMPKYRQQQYPFPGNYIWPGLLDLQFSRSHCYAYCEGGMDIVDVDGKRMNWELVPVKNSPIIDVDSVKALLKSDLEVFDNYHTFYDYLQL